MKVLAVVGLASIVSTCGYDRDPTGVSDVREAQTASQGGPVYAEERRAVELARQIPDLAGFYFDTSGNVIVLLKGVAASPSKKTLLWPRFGNELSRGRRRNPAADLIVRTADYSFLELKGWRDRLMNADILTTPGVVWLDLDEFRNRVVIGLDVGADPGAARAIAEGLAIPFQALAFEVTGPYVRQQTLRDEFRPLQGGIQIQRVSGASRVGCTLGFTALRNSQQVFLTAGHCSPNPTGTDSVAQFQPVAPLTHAESLTMSPIGREIFQYSEPCGNRRCSYSDAAIYGLIPTPAWGLGRVARPASGCFPGPCNPPVLDLAPQPYWVIDTTHEGFIVGELVSEIGSATGWSQGSVQRTCVNVTPMSGVQYNCQMFASYGANDGDSGAPILLDIMGGADSTVTLGGIHSGRSGKNAVFSPWSGIVQDYGLLSVVSPQRPQVPPTAPDTVPAWVYAPANLASDTGASYDYYADVIIVGFKATATQADRQAAIDSINGTVVGGQPMPPGEGFYFVRLEAGRRLEPLTLAVTKLWSMPQVASASLVTPLEEQFRRPKDQGDFASWETRPDSAAGQNWGLEEAAAPLAWGCETGRDAAPPIAFVDNGFHSVGDLTPNVTAAGAAHAQYGSQATHHGTQVASVAGAQGDNTLRMTGMAWDADLRLYQTPLISPPTMDGIRIVAQGGARVVNISLSIPWKSKPKNTWKDSLQVLGVASQLRVTLQNLANQGFPILVVQGAGNGVGNNGIDAFWQAFGASIDHDSLRHGGPRFRESVLVVAASERQQAGVRRLAVFSDTGASIDLAAPGVDVGTLDRFGSVVLASGTSLSAPYVTGLGALLLAFDTTLTTADVRQFILEGARRGGRVAIDRNGGGRTYPIVNAYEALKRAAERQGAPLCGNRVWVNNNAVIVERDPVTHTTEQLIALGSPASFVNARHGGRRIEVSTDTSTRAFELRQGQWVETPDTATTPYGGTFTSTLAFSHDADTLATATYWTSGDSALFEHTIHTFNPSTTRILDTLIVTLSRFTGSDCVRRASDETCTLERLTVGVEERVQAEIAYAPTGNRLFVAVTYFVTRLVELSGWQPCPLPPPGPQGDPDPTTCRNATYQEVSERTDLWGIDLQSGQETRSTWTFPGGVYWFGISEDGGQIVSGEGVRTAVWTWQPRADGSGFEQVVSNPGTVTGCAVHYRNLASGAEVAPQIPTADPCTERGQGSISPAPRALGGASR